jgi:hypothetical protein
LIDKSNNRDLARSVRLVSGQASVNGRSSAHKWLEIKRNGKWISYETTKNDLYRFTSIDPASIDAVVASSEVLNPTCWSYIRTNSLQVDADGREHRNLNVVGALRSRGLASLLTEHALMK